MQPHRDLDEADHLLPRRWEVADIFRLYGDAYRLHHPLSEAQRKAMRDIELCRTAALGGHVETCENGCGFTRISYNSCRNRNCPKCQGLKSAQWLEKRFETILPVPYFHMVFTLPHELVPIAIHNKPVTYSLLFRAAAESLLEFARDWDRLKAQVGFTAILHTWNQDLEFHPHLHIVVTGGGVDESGTRWIASRNNFLVPVRALSKKFRGKFLDVLKRAFAEDRLVFGAAIEDLGAPQVFGRLIKRLYRKKWVVYSKQPFGGPEQVFSYLGLYTHRVAISNHRLVEVSEGKVTFVARDNAHPGQKRSVSLTAEEFIRRFLLHILPRGFVKIRHYGLMAPRNAKTKLAAARRLIEQAQPTKTASPSRGETQDLSRAASWQDLFRRITGIDLTTCPSCGANLIRQPLGRVDTLGSQAGEQAVCYNPP